MEPISRARKDFLEHNGVIELPQSEWGPVYNADGSDPYICPGSQLRAYNSRNPMGKNGYELRNGVIVPKEEALTYPDPLEDINKIEYINDIEYRVFLKNNPGITLRKSMDGWGSFDRWTYIECGPYRVNCFPKWDEKVIPIKMGIDFSSVDESSLFHVAGNMYGYTQIMDYELDSDATNPKMQALKYAAPSPIIDYKHDPKYTQEYVIDVSKTKWAK